MLRIGHKFAFKANLRGSLSRLIKETDDKLGKKFANLTTLEAKNWHNWKLENLRKIIRIQDNPDRIELRLNKGIRDLKNLNVVIKQADKNLGLVPIRGDIYNAMVRGWLEPPSFQLVTTFPHRQLLYQLKDLLFQKDMHRYQRKLWIQHAENSIMPSPFYASPKIHKKKLGSRPINAQHSYMLAPISRYLAGMLQFSVEAHNTIGKDSKTTVKRLEELQLPESFVLATYDVEACYPSIDIEDAIRTLHENINFLQVENGINTKLLEMIMKKNYVIANDKVYLQKIGTATGTQVAPQFANLYLYFKYKEALSDPNIIFQERFIDDGLLIVKTREDAVRIIKNIQDSSSLSLTWEISDSKAIYLDLEIYKGNRYIMEKKLDLRTYFKPTNKMLYLPSRSHHPKHMKTGIIRGEAIRTLRNSSSKDEWLKSLRLIFKGLMARGYNPDMIKDKWKSVRFEERDFYIICSTPKTIPEGLLIKTSYNPRTMELWTKMLTDHPVTEILKPRRERWNPKQATIIKKWPPKILWVDFRKVSHRTINSKDYWKHKKQLKRPRPSTDNPPTEQPLKRLKTLLTA